MQLALINKWVLLVSSVLSALRCRRRYPAAAANPATAAKELLRWLLCC
jgi:hypothetical protein